MIFRGEKVWYRTVANGEEEEEEEGGVGALEGGVLER